MQKYHTNSHGPDHNALARAYQHMLKLARRQNAIAYITTHTIKNVTVGLPTILGHDGVERLTKEKSLSVDDVIIHLQTEKIAPSIDTSGPILAPYVSLRLALAVLEDPKASALVYVPWMEEELAAYLAANRDSEEI